jgi:hypothetical protein
VNAEALKSNAGPEDEDDATKSGAAEAGRNKRTSGRQPLPPHLKRDLPHKCASLQA